MKRIKAVVSSGTNLEGIKLVKERRDGEHWHPSKCGTTASGELSSDTSSLYTRRIISSL